MRYLIPSVTGGHYKRLPSKTALMFPVFYQQVISFIRAVQRQLSFTQTSLNKYESRLSLFNIHYFCRRYTYQHEDMQHVIVKIHGNTDWKV